MDAAEEPGPTTEGRRLGKYHLIAELARGGMGVVYLAVVRGPRGFHKLFVVKELRAHLAEDPGLVSMFLEEARLAAKLNHRNVVQTIEVDSDRGRHFIAMEYLDGQSYGRLLARLRNMGAAFPLSGHLYVLSQVLEGLQYAHAPAEPGAWKPSIVHRDVSPQNVLLTFDGQVKLIDFGIAKTLESPNQTKSGMLKGKLAYMAPEQAASDPLDGRTDIFSVGVMLWEAAVGSRMWSKAPSDMRILHSLASGAVPRPGDEKPDIDPDLEQMILRATAPKASNRYANAAEFQADIENHLRWLAEPSFGAREIQKLLSGAFAEERAATKALIDAQLRSTSVPDEPTPATGVRPVELPITQTDRTPLEELASVPSGRDATRTGTGRRRAAVVLTALAAAGAVGLAGTFKLSHPPEKRGEAATLASALPPVAAANPPSSPGVSNVPGSSAGTNSRWPGVAEAAAVATANPTSLEAGRKPQGFPGHVEWPARPKRVVNGPANPDRSAPDEAPPVESAPPPPRSDGPAPEAAEPAPRSPPPGAGRVRKPIDTQDPYAN
jgi:eukaryotic-like serine/threonine-protein kinase